MSVLSECKDSECFDIIRWEFVLKHSKYHSYKTIILNCHYYLMLFLQGG